MKPLTIADSETIILGLQDEIRRSEESRYDHRLHGVLLVAHGMTCPEAAALLGDAPRTVEYWIRGFEQRGLAALRDGERSGRPGRLSKKHLRGINAALRRMPRAVGLGGNVWDGKTLAAWIQRAVRDCFGRAAVSAFVPAVGLSAAQTAPCHCSGGSRTAEGAKKNSKY